MFAFISLIPWLSHRLSYVTCTFRIISWSCVNSPTITWLPMRYASICIIHMYPMCVAWFCKIRITIGCTRLKHSLNFISFFNLHWSSWLRIKTSIVHKAEIDCMPSTFKPWRLSQFWFSIKCFFVLSMSDIKELTKLILWNGNSLSSMW